MMSIDRFRRLICIHRGALLVCDLLSGLVVYFRKQTWTWSQQFQKQEVAWKYDFYRINEIIQWQYSWLPFSWSLDHCQSIHQNIELLTDRRLFCYFTMYQWSFWKLLPSLNVCQKATRKKKGRNVMITSAFFPFISRSDEIQTT